MRKNHYLFLPVLATVLLSVQVSHAGFFDFICNPFGSHPVAAPAPLPPQAFQLYNNFNSIANSINPLEAAVLSLPNTLDSIQTELALSKNPQQVLKKLLFPTLERLNGLIGDHPELLLDNAYDGNPLLEYLIAKNTALNQKIISFNNGQKKAKRDYFLRPNSLIYYFFMIVQQNAGEYAKLRTDNASLAPLFAKSIVSFDNPKALKILEKNNPQLYLIPDPRGNTLLHDAVKLKSYKTFHYLLEKDKQDSQSQGFFGYIKNFGHSIASGIQKLFTGRSSSYLTQVNHAGDSAFDDLLPDEAKPFLKIAITGSTDNLQSQEYDRRYPDTAGNLHAVRAIINRGSLRIEPALEIIKKISDANRSPEQAKIFQYLDHYYRPSYLRSVKKFFGMHHDPNYQEFKKLAFDAKDLLCTDKGKNNFVSSIREIKDIYKEARPNIANKSLLTDLYYGIPSGISIYRHGVEQGIESSFGPRYRDALTNGINTFEKFVDLIKRGKALGEHLAGYYFGFPPHEQPAPQQISEPNPQSIPPANNALEYAEEPNNIAALNPNLQAANGFNTNLYNQYSRAKNALYHYAYHYSGKAAFDAERRLEKDALAIGDDLVVVLENFENKLLSIAKEKFPDKHLTDTNQVLLHIFNEIDDILAQPLSLARPYHLYSSYRRGNTLYSFLMEFLDEFFKDTSSNNSPGGPNQSGHHEPISNRNRLIKISGKTHELLDEIENEFPQLYGRLDPKVQANLKILNSFAVDFKNELKKLQNKDYIPLGRKILDLFKSIVLGGLPLQRAQDAHI